jgi:hypothetical protein
MRAAATHDIARPTSFPTAANGQQNGLGVTGTELRRGRPSTRAWNLGRRDAPKRASSALWASSVTGMGAASRSTSSHRVDSWSVFPVEASFIFYRYFRDVEAGVFEAGGSGLGTRLCPKGQSQQARALGGARTVPTPLTGRTLLRLVCDTAAVRWRSSHGLGTRLCPKGQSQQARALGGARTVPDPLDRADVAAAGLRHSRGPMALESRSGNATVPEGSVAASSRARGRSDCSGPP